MNTHQSTSNNLLRFLYDEMTERERADFVGYLDQNPTAQQQFDELIWAINCLESIQYTPGEDSLNRVLKYASFDQINPQ
jgi:hypothetical protein